MSKVSRRALTRLLVLRRTVEPPADLADRIKAEIPDFAAVGGTGLRAERVAGMPPREASYRPLLLVAATLIVVVGVGFIAAHLLEPPTELARDVALGGVTVIDDIVVTVPPRAVTEPSPRPASPVPATSEPRATNAVGGAAVAVPSGTLTVVVRRTDGAPCAGVTVKLQRTDMFPPWRGDAATDAAGVAFFPDVPVGTYTLSAGPPAAAPATIEGLRVNQKTTTRVDLRVTPRRRRALLPF
jgi:hypothetical protein